MNNNNNLKKDYPLAENLVEERLDENHSLKKMLRLIGENKRVVDFGCATGYLSQLLTKKGCRVTGVELNPDAAKIAEQYCEQVIVADLDLVPLTEILPEQAFDVAIFGDVLEHLRDPWKILKETQQLLNSEGYVVASIPNIAHGSIRLALLQGKFEYTELGILDNTHLRFFTRKTIEELCESCGYFIDNIERTKLSIFADVPLIPHINRDDFNSEVIQQVEQQEEVETFQFIVRAFPGSQKDRYAALNERYLKIAVQLEQAKSHLQAIQSELDNSQAQVQQSETEKTRSQAQLQEIQAEIENTQLQLQQTQSELDNSQAQVQQSETEKMQLQAQLQHTQAEIENTQLQLQQTQSELDNLQAQVQQSETEKMQLQAQLQHTQTELDNSQVQLQQTQLELDNSQAQVQQSETAKTQLQAQVQHTQTELDNSQAQLQHTQAELARSQAQLQHTQAELARSPAQLQHTQTELDNSQAQLQHTQAELARSQSIISGMESSKFWKLRTAWFRLKQAIGLTDNSPQTTAALDGIATSEINLSEIKFKVAARSSLNGYFDGINGFSTTKIKMPMTTPLNASGWAILADEGRPADRVIITHGKNNSLVAVAPVNLERPDVVKALNNPAYKNSGWSITLNSAILPAGQIFFEAWAYNAATKEAIRLNYANFNLRFSHLLSRLKHYHAVLRVKGIRYGLTKLSKKIYYKLDTQPPIELLQLASPNDQPYAKWLNKNFPREADLRKIGEIVEVLGYKPVISVIMPVYNTPQHFLREAIESVLNQIYPHWELCIADDASTKPYIRTVLQEYVAKDSRIKVVFRTENGHISRASNSALEIATGEFVALLDHDDLLTPDALGEVALLLNKHPNADMIYSDEDKIDENYQLKEPFFKPDWCPDSFLSRMYTCHLGTYRRSLFTEIGGFRVGYEGSQDYDLILRLTEKTESIFHIPKILYHWRIHGNSTASSLSSKSYATDAAQKALLEALYRRGESGKVIPVNGGHHIVRYEIKDFKLVSIIIPTRNLGNVLDNCLKSIFEKTIYPNYEVLVIDNGSNEVETLNIINQWEVREPDRFRCQVLNIPFNYSKINNYAVEHSQGEYLLFLNNDTEVLTPDWIDAMVEQAQRPCIGAVGALLLYPDNTIQHAGVVGVGGVAGHSHKHYPADVPGYFNQIQTVNNYSAVTAACLMCRREVFEAVGGFEEQLIVSLNDVDLCLKIVEQGYRNIYLPHVVLYHYESKSRGYEDTPEKQARFIKEVKYMQHKWKNFITHDPCYSPNLNKEREDFSIGI